MNPRDRRLRKEIVVILIIKLIAITALWWLLSRDDRIIVDATETARHLGGHEQSSIKPPRQGVLNAQ